MYAGLQAAAGDLVAIMDADLQDPPQLLPAVVLRGQGTQQTGQQGQEGKLLQGPFRQGKAEIQIGGAACVRLRAQNLDLPPGFPGACCPEGLGGKIRRSQAGEGGQGCPFASRCTQARPECLGPVPYRSLDGGRVRCLYPEGGNL